MQNIPVAVSEFAFLALNRPQPKVRSKATGEQATTAEGLPIYLTELLALPAAVESTDKGQQVMVSTAGEPPLVERGDPVFPEGLVARQYSFQNDAKEQIKGVTFWATVITNLRPAPARQAGS